MFWRTSCGCEKNDCWLSGVEKVGSTVTLSTAKRHRDDVTVDDRVCKDSLTLETAVCIPSRSDREKTTAWKNASLFVWMGQLHWLLYFCCLPQDHSNKGKITATMITFQSSIIQIQFNLICFYTQTSGRPGSYFTVSPVWTLNTHWIWTVSAAFI